MSVNRGVDKEKVVHIYSFIQVATGRGSPVMDTSILSLFPATTTIAFSEVCPEQSRWILGGSGGRGESLGNLGVDS